MSRTVSIFMNYNKIVTLYFPICKKTLKIMYILVFLSFEIIAIMLSTVPFTYVHKTYFNVILYQFNVLPRFQNEY